jgi:two-component system, cell cycle sensor histidine kinase and response regulator CckA
MIPMEYNFSAGSIRMPQHHGYLKGLVMHRKELDQLKEQNDLLNSIFVNTTDAVYVKDLNGRYLMINPAGADFIGKSIAQVLGRDDSELFPPESVATIRDRDRRAQESSAPCTTEEVLTINGVTRTYLSSKGAYRDAHGNVIGIFGIARDITERKAMEQQLRDSETREKARADELDALMNSVPAAVLIAHDPDCSNITGSRAANEMLRVATGGNLSKSAPVGIRPDHYRIFKDGVETPVRDLPVQRAARGEEIRDCLQEIVFTDGERRFILGNATPLRDQDGNLRGAVSAFVDITERKRMIEALQTSEEQFRTLCDFAPIGIYQADFSGRNTYMNPRWEEIMEMSAAEGMDLGWNERIHPDDRAEILSVWLEATAACRSYAHECRIITPEGKTKWIRALGTPLKKLDCQLTGYVGTLEDITTLRQAGKEMMKVEKLESLGVLAGGIAHDFNNFLTAILGNISLARMQLHDPEMMAKRMQDAENATIHARDLTQQLMTFARGGIPVKKNVDIGKLLQDEARFAMHGSAISCTFEFADSLWPVEADEGQLSQVIHNLVINAAQSMPNGGTVTIGAKNVCSAQGEKFVKISVTDTGTGIPESHLQRIFDPYFTTKQQGSGLGLATSHSIIAKHGGKLRATSTLGKGSVFSISLPASDHKFSVGPDECADVAHGSGRILVMDDEESIRDVARAMLEELGYTAESVVEGTEAVALYRQRLAEGSPFTAVIMDLTIPGGIGGKEAIHRLRAIDPEVKAIVSSGYSTDPVMANYREYGFSGVLIKPYRIEEISKILREVL